MAEVNIAGHKMSRGAAIAVGVGGVVVVYFAYKQHKNAAANAAAASTTGSNSNIDPQTGYAYGSAEDQAALSQMQGAGYGNTGYGSYGYGSYGSGSYGSGTTYAPNTQGSTTYADNAAWSQAVEAGLSQIGYSSTDVASAIGRYLARLQVTPTQADIINVAVAEYGPPPVGSYSVILGPTNNGGGGGSTNVTVPDVIGESQADAYTAIGAAGLRAATTTKPVHGEILYVTSQHPKAGSSVAQGSTVTVTSHTHNSPKPPGPHPKPKSDEVTVPNVIGQTQETAFENLQDVGLHATGSRVVHGKVLIVHRQSPKAGTKVKKGSTVHLTSSVKK